MHLVEFYYREEFLCGDGCCTLYGDDVMVARREVTDEQLEALQKSNNRSGTSRWTEDFGIEGEDEKFTYFCVL